jgi:hypothetical protein
MTEASEEFDRTRAFRRVAFNREIPTVSLEGYWQRWDTTEEACGDEGDHAAIIDQAGRKSTLTRRTE